MAVSALHMTYLKSKKQVYQILTAKHESFALSAICVALQSIQEQNCYVLHAYTQIFVKCALTDISASANLLFMSEKDKFTILVHLIQEAFAIHDTYFMWLAEGSLKTFMQISLNCDFSFDQNSDDLQLTLLMLKLTA